MKRGRLAPDDAWTARRDGMDLPPNGASAGSSRAPITFQASSGSASKLSPRRQQVGHLIVDFTLGAVMFAGRRSDGE